MQGIPFHRLSVAKVGPTCREVLRRGCSTLDAGEERRRASKPEVVPQEGKIGYVRPVVAVEVGAIVVARVAQRLPESRSQDVKVGHIDTVIVVSVANAQQAHLLLGSAHA